MIVNFEYDELRMIEVVCSHVINNLVWDNCYGCFCDGMADNKFITKTHELIYLINGIKKLHKTRENYISHPESSKIDYYFSHQPPSLKFSIINEVLIEQGVRYE